MPYHYDEDDEERRLVEEYMRRPVQAGEYDRGEALLRQGETEVAYLQQQRAQQAAQPQPAGFDPAGDPAVIAEGQRRQEEARVRLEEFNRRAVEEREVRRQAEVAREQALLQQGREAREVVQPSPLPPSPQPTPQRPPAESPFGIPVAEAQARTAELRRQQASAAREEEAKKRPLGITPSDVVGGVVKRPEPIEMVDRGEKGKALGRLVSAKRGQIPLEELPQAEKVEEEGERPSPSPRTLRPPPIPKAKSLPPPPEVEAALREVTDVVAGKRTVRRPATGFLAGIFGEEGKPQSYASLDEEDKRAFLESHLSRVVKVYREGVKAGTYPGGQEAAITQAYLQQTRRGRSASEVGTAVRKAMEGRWQMQEELPASVQEEVETLAAQIRPIEERPFEERYREEAREFDRRNEEVIRKQYDILRKAYRDLGWSRQEADAQAAKDVDLSLSATDIAATAGVGLATSLPRLGATTLSLIDVLIPAGTETEESLRRRIADIEKGIEDFGKAHLPPAARAALEQAALEEDPDGLIPWFDGRKYTLVQKRFFLQAVRVSAESAPLAGAAFVYGRGVALALRKVPKMSPAMADYLGYAVGNAVELAGESRSAAISTLVDAAEGAQNPDGTRRFTPEEVAKIVDVGARMVTDKVFALGMLTGAVSGMQARLVRGVTAQNVAARAMALVGTELPQQAVEEGAQERIEALTEFVALHGREPETSEELAEIEQRTITAGALGAAGAGATATAIALTERVLGGIPEGTAPPPIEPPPTEPTAEPDLTTPPPEEPITLEEVFEFYEEAPPTPPSDITEGAPQPLPPQPGEVSPPPPQPLLDEVGEEEAAPSVPPAEPDPLEQVPPNQPLRPALLAPTGEVIIGQQGDLHGDVADRAGIRTADELDQHEAGFTLPDGTFLSRVDAARYARARTEELDALDLPSETAHPTALFQDVILSNLSVNDAKNAVNAVRAELGEEAPAELVVDVLRRTVPPSPARDEAERAILATADRAKVELPVEVEEGLAALVSEEEEVPRIQADLLDQPYTGDFEDVRRKLEVTAAGDPELRSFLDQFAEAESEAEEGLAPLLKRARRQGNRVALPDIITAFGFEPEDVTQRTLDKARAWAEDNGLTVIPLGLAERVEEVAEPIEEVPPRDNVISLQDRLGQFRQERAEALTSPLQPATLEESLQAFERPEQPVAETLEEEPTRGRQAERVEEGREEKTRPAEVPLPEEVTLPQDVERGIATLVKPELMVEAPVPPPAREEGPPPEAPPEPPPTIEPPPFAPVEGEEPGVEDSTLQRERDASQQQLLEDARGILDRGLSAQQAEDAFLGLQMELAASETYLGPADIARMVGEEVPPSRQRDRVMEKLQGLPDPFTRPPSPERRAGPPPIEGEAEITPPTPAPEAEIPTEAGGVPLPPSSRLPTPPAQPKTPSFQTWFKDSKAVGRMGTPKVVHYLPAEGETRFDPQRLEGPAPQKVDSMGFVFSSPEEAAEYFAEADLRPVKNGSNLAPVTLRVLNPTEVARGEVEGWVEQPTVDSNSDGLHVITSEGMRRRGFAPEVWVLFNPGQVRGATELQQRIATLPPGLIEAAEAGEGPAEVPGAPAPRPRGPEPAASIGFEEERLPALREAFERGAQLEGTSIRTIRAAERKQSGERAIPKGELDQGPGAPKPRQPARVREESAKEKEAVRSTLAEQIEEFKRRGGKVTELPPEVAPKGGKVGVKAEKVIPRVPEAVGPKKPLQTLPPTKKGKKGILIPDSDLPSGYIYTKAKDIDPELRAELARAARRLFGKEEKGKGIPARVIVVQSIINKLTGASPVGLAHLPDRPDGILQPLVVIALDAYDPKAILHHEAWHVMERFALTEDEYQELKLNFRPGSDAYQATINLLQKSGGENVIKAIKRHPWEARAYAAQLRSTGELDFKPAINRLLDKSVAVAKGIGRWLRGAGLRRVDDLYEKFEKGELGKRGIIADRPEAWGMEGRTRRVEGGRAALSEAGPTSKAPFRAWFGNSRIRNKDGTPRVLYHGTDTDFPAFGRGDIGFHFGTLKQAEKITEVRVFPVDRILGKGDFIIPVYLKIENPIRLKDYSDWRPRDIAQELATRGIIPQEEVQTIRGLEDRLPQWTERDSYNNPAYKRLRELIQAKGYDGIAYTNRYEKGGTSYIAFFPEQVKSAIGNKGAYDPSLPGLVESIGPTRLWEDVRQVSANEWTIPWGEKRARIFVNPTEDQWKAVPIGSYILIARDGNVYASDRSPEGGSGPALLHKHLVSFFRDNNLPYQPEYEDALHLNRIRDDRGILSDLPFSAEPGSTIDTIRKSWRDAEKRARRNVPALRIDWRLVPEDVESFSTVESVGPKKPDEKPLPDPLSKLKDNYKRILGEDPPDISWEGIDSPEKLAEAIAKFRPLGKRQLDKAKRGRIPMEKLIAEAASRMEQPTKFLQRKIGEGLDPADVVVGAMMYEAAKREVAARKDTLLQSGSIEDAQEFNIAHLRASVIHAQYYGGVSESARALRAQRTMKGIFRSKEFRERFTDTDKALIGYGGQEGAMRMANIVDKALKKGKYGDLIRNPGIQDVFAEYYLNAILSRISTHNVNFRGNLFEAASRPILTALAAWESRKEDPTNRVYYREAVASTIGTFVGAVEGAYILANTANGTLKSITGGLGKASKELVTGHPIKATRTFLFEHPEEPEIDSNLLEEDYARTKAIPGRFGVLIRAQAFIPLSAMDAAFKQIARRQLEFELQLRDGINKGLSTEKLWEGVGKARSVYASPEARNVLVNGLDGKTWEELVATKPQVAADVLRILELEEFAKLQTYTSPITDSFSKMVISWLRTVPILRIVSGVPFVRTPVNINKARMRMLLGFNRLLKDVKEDLEKGGVPAAYVRARVDLGLLLLMSMIGMSLLGSGRGGGPPDRRRNKQWREEGNVPYSIGGSPIIQYGSVGQVLATGLDLGDMVRETFLTPEWDDNRFFRGLGVALRGLIKVPLEQLYLEGLATLYENVIGIAEGENKLSAPIKGIARGVVPGMISQLHERIPPIVREVRTPGEAIISATGGAETLSIAQDALGNPVIRRGGALTRLTTPLLRRASPEAKLLYRLSNWGVSLGEPSHTYEDPRTKERIEWTPFQYEILKHIRGELLTDMLKRRIYQPGGGEKVRPEWEKLSYSFKRDQVAKMSNQAGQAAARKVRAMSGKKLRSAHNDLLKKAQEMAKK